MSIPSLSTCNLTSREKKSSNLVVHCLDELMVEDVYIPKKPHRHTFYQVLYIQSGEGLHKIDFNDYPIRDNSMFFLAPGQVHNLNILADAKGILINFDETLFHTFLSKSDIIRNYPFFQSSGKHSYFQLSEPNENIVDALNRIRTNKETNDLVRLYLLEIFYLVNQRYKAAQDQTYSSGQKLMSEFDALVEENYDLEHYPKFYASELSVTPNYLNAVCQKMRSKKAGDIIRDRIFLETKRLLVNSKLNIAEIAYMLGYDDNSYFTKSFKKYEGLTPAEFRKQL